VSQHQTDLVHHAGACDGSGDGLGVGQVLRQWLLTEHGPSRGDDPLDQRAMLGSPRADVHRVAGIDHRHRIGDRTRVVPMSERIGARRIRVEHRAYAVRHGRTLEAARVRVRDQPRAEEADAYFAPRRGHECERAA
jgi:hypothetical protein